MRRCQRTDDASSASSPGLGRRFPEGARGRKTIGLRAEGLMDKFRKANPVSRGRGEGGVIVTSRAASDRLLPLERGVFWREWC